MLVLKRKVGENVVLQLENEKEIRVCVKEISSNYVRLGFEASDNVVIMREELLNGTKKSM